MYKPRVTCKIDPNREDVKITIHTQGDNKWDESFELNPRDCEILKKLITSYFSDDNYKATIEYSNMLDFITVGWAGSKPYIAVRSYHDDEVDEMLTLLKHIIKVVEFHQTVWKLDNTLSE